MSIIATVNEGTRLTIGRITKLIPGIGRWAVPGLLYEVKTNGGRNVNGVHISYKPASEGLNTHEKYYGVFVISEWVEPESAVKTCECGNPTDSPAGICGTCSPERYAISVGFGPGWKSNAAIGATHCEANTGVQHGPANKPAGRDTSDRCAVCHREAHRPGLRNGNHGHDYVAPTPARKVYSSDTQFGDLAHVVAADTLAQGDVLDPSRDVITRVAPGKEGYVLVYLEGREDPTLTKATNRYRVLAKAGPQPVEGTTDTYTPDDTQTIVAAFLGYATPDATFARQHAFDLMVTARRSGWSSEENGNGDTRVTITNAGLGYYRLVYASLV